jgi:hypothetical protein
MDKFDNNFYIFRSKMTCKDLINTYKGKPALNFMNREHFYTPEFHDKTVTEEEKRSYCDVKYCTTKRILLC